MIPTSVAYGAVMTLYHVPSPSIKRIAVFSPNPMSLSRHRLSTWGFLSNGGMWGTTYRRRVVLVGSMLFLNAVDMCSMESVQ